MIINLLETTSLVQDFNEYYYFVFYEQNMCEHFYAYLIQPLIDDSFKEKIFRFIKILLFKIKKVPDKYKHRLRLADVNSGGINGLLSKMLSNTSVFQTNSINSKLIDENFVLNLIEIFLDNHNDSAFINSISPAPSSPKTPESTKKAQNQFTNFDSLWTILSLMMPSVTCFNNYWQHRIDDVLRIRLKLCKFLFSFIESNLSSVQYLVKSHGWQDILCQYLCYSQKTLNNSEHVDLSESQILQQSQIKKTNIVTSTPTIKTTTISYREKHSLREFKKFSSLSVDDKLQSFDEKDELAINNDGEPNLFEYPNKQIATLTTNNRRQKFFSMNQSSIEQDIDIKEINLSHDSNTDTEAAHDIDVVKNSLCNKVVNLLFKLAWNGLSGSNEGIWKVGLVLKMNFSIKLIEFFFIFRNVVKYFLVYIV